MTEKIHYDDNIFYLTALITTVSDGLKLSIDPDYFSEKILEDVFFIDSAIQKAYGSLRSNTHLIKRNAYLHSIMKLKKAFSRLVEEILSLEGPFSDRMSQVFPKLRRSAAAHLKDVREIREQLKDLDGPKLDSDLISYSELNYLMTPVEPDEE